MNTEILSPVTLPYSGRTMTNRLTKVAMYEHMAKMYGGPPNKYHLGLYAEWAKYDWGMIITGNIQVSRGHLTLGRDMVVPEVLTEETLAPFRMLAQTIHDGDQRKPSTRPLALVQLSHVGRQSPNFVGGRRLGVPPVAPSPVRLGSNKRVPSNDGITSLDAPDTPHLYFRVLFQQPREMTLHDIKQAQESFIKGALIALHAGFDGVQLHCAHGCGSFRGVLEYIFSTFPDLLAQFLDPKTNIRQDAYSVNSLRMLREIVQGVRAVVPNDFVIGVKVNSADYVEAGERPSDERVLNETRRVLDHIRTIAHWGMIDFIEISGGDYESPDFMSSKATSPRQAFFSQFAKKARECIETDVPSGVNVPLVLLTGGLRSPAHLQSALDAGHADLLGIGRGSILCPDIPTILRQRIQNSVLDDTLISLDDEPFAQEPDSRIQLPWWIPQIPLVGAGASMAWYNVRMREIALSQLVKTEDGTLPSAPQPTFEMTGLESIVRLWVWLEWQGIFIGALSVYCMGVLIYHSIYGF